VTDAVLVEVISALTLLVVTILQIRSERERKRRKKQEAEREQRQDERQKDDLELAIVQGRVSLATGNLAYVTSVAVTGGHTNGDVEQAQEEFKSAKKASDELRALLAKKYLKGVEM